MLSLKSQRGHGHLLLFAALVVAGVGAVGYGVYQKTGVKDVANASVLHADNATATAANTTGGATAKDTRKAAIVLYSEQGKYHYAEIELDNSNGNVHHCGQQKLNQTDGDFVRVKLKTNGPTQIPCSAVKDKEFYRVWFSATAKDRNGLEDSDQQGPKIVDIDRGYCTHVHNNVDGSSKTAFTNGKCAPQPDNIVKTDAAITTNLDATTLTPTSKKVRFYASVRPTGISATHESCAGQIYIALYSATDNKVVKSVTGPIKVTRKAKNGDPSAQFCASKMEISASKLKSNTEYYASVHFLGNAYMNPGDATSGRFTTPTFQVKVKPQAASSSKQKTTKN